MTIIKTRILVVTLLMSLATLSSCEKDEAHPKENPGGNVPRIREIYLDETIHEKFEYSTDGAIIRSTRFVNEAPSVITTYAYNDRNLLMELLQTDASTGAPMRKWVYSYENDLAVKSEYHAYDGTHWEIQTTEQFFYEEGVYRYSTISFATVTPPPGGVKSVEYSYTENSILQTTTLYNGVVTHVTYTYYNTIKLPTAPYEFKTPQTLRNKAIQSINYEHNPEGNSTYTYDVTEGFANLQTQQRNGGETFVYRFVYE